MMMVRHENIGASGSVQTRSCLDTNLGCDRKWRLKIVRLSREVEPLDQHN